MQRPVERVVRLKSVGPRLGAADLFKVGHCVPNMYY